MSERPATHAPEPLNDTRWMRIFVYGSSMNSSAIRECCPGGMFFATAYLPDNELCFPRWDQDKGTFIVGYEPAVDKHLWGVVWLIPESERSSLDNAKGCHPGQPGHRYDRVPITCLLYTSPSPRD